LAPIAIAVNYEAARLQVIPHIFPEMANSPYIRFAEGKGEMK
jgi:hypothetical protein